MRNHTDPRAAQSAATNPRSPQSPSTPNPQSLTSNHRLYASLRRRPGAAETDALVAVARDFSPRYEVHSADLVVIDVSGLERLLGPARVIGEELRAAVAARGISAHVALASTQTAATILAHTRPGLTVIAPGGEADALAPIAVGILASVDVGRQQAAGVQHTAQVILQTCGRWGIRTLGELAALPDAELVSRFGRHAVAWQMIARGIDRQPLVPTLDEERFAASLDLEWPIEGLEPLSFVLTRLLEPLCTRLERRDRGAAVLHVLLDLVGGGSHVRRLELPTPIRDVRALRTLALLDLESHSPDAAIDRVRIVVDPTPGRVLQHALFTRAQPTPEQLSTLLARLAAVMGQDRVGAAAMLDTYRPGAFAMTPFATVHSGGERTGGSATGLVSALRRCRQPVPARVAVDAEGRPVRVTTDRRGYAGGAVTATAGPWRTSGDWWMASGQSPRQGEGFWDRDEWEVALGDGAVYRIFRDRATDGWYIDAIVD